MAREGCFQPVQGANYYIAVGDEWLLCRPGSSKVVHNRILQITPLTILLESTEEGDLSKFGFQLAPEQSRFRRADIDWLELIARVQLTARPA